MNEMNPYKAPEPEEGYTRLFNMLRETGIGDPLSRMDNDIPFGEDAKRLDREFDAWATGHPDAARTRREFVEYLREKFKERIRNNNTPPDKKRARILAISRAAVRSPIKTLMRVLDGHAIVRQDAFVEDIHIEDTFNEFARKRKDLHATIRPPIPDILRKGQKVEVTTLLQTGQPRTVTGVLSENLSYTITVYQLYIDTYPTRLYESKYPSKDQYRITLDGSVTRVVENPDSSYVIYFRDFDHKPERYQIWKPICE